MKSFSELSCAFAGTPLFAGKSWRIAARAWEFSAEETRELNRIGSACLAFYRASEKLYIASAEGKSLLRNAELYAPWVAEILDRGKPERFIKHQRACALAGSLPPVIRPDLLFTEDGFALTELDSVPGGIGLTAFLEKSYSGKTAMPELFLNAITGGDVSLRAAIAVSEESATYRPEFEWLAKTLNAEHGAKISVCSPNDLEIGDDGVRLRRERVDVVYRFFELFDWRNFPQQDALARAAECGKVRVLPPMRPFQEEKMSLALFRHPALEAFWREQLGEENFSVLRKIVPASWIFEPVEDLPASAVLVAPKPMRDWRELGAFPRRERNYVLKASGFCEDAWGARSVTVGNDASQREWEDAVAHALDSGRNGNLYVLQEFRKAARVNFDVFDGAGIRGPLPGRARICPYYFVLPGGKNRLGGALATVCPVDKKTIHGMDSASLAPCSFCAMS